MIFCIIIFIYYIIAAFTFYALFSVFPSCTFSEANSLFRHLLHAKLTRFIRLFHIFTFTFVYL